MIVPAVVSPSQNLRLRETVRDARLRQHLAHQSGKTPRRGRPRAVIIEQQPAHQAALPVRLQIVDRPLQRVGLQDRVGIHQKQVVAPAHRPGLVVRRGKTPVVLVGDQRRFGEFAAHQIRRAIGRGIVHHDGLDRSAGHGLVQNRLETGGETIRGFVGHDEDRGADRCGDRDRLGWIHGLLGRWIVLPPSKASPMPTRITSTLFHWF